MTIFLDKILENIEIVAESLKNGNIILCCTDTVYGLICDSNNDVAVQKIYNIKQRDIQKQCAIFAPSMNWIAENCQINDIILDILNHFLPGKFTFILNLKNIENDDKTIGIRIPDDIFIQQLLKLINIPLLATSANISSQKDSSIFALIDERIKTAVDICLVDSNTKEKQPSTIIDLTEIELNKQYKILRNGEYVEEFKKYANNLYLQNH